MLQLGVTYVQINTDNSAYVRIDVEDNNQQGDSKSEAKLKEFNFKSIEGLERKFNFAYSFDYIFFNSRALASIALDIATPPPRG